MKCGKCQDDIPEHGDCVVCVGCALRFHFDCSIREAKWRNMTAEQKGKWACSKCKGDSVLSRSNSTSSGVDSVDEEQSTKSLLLHINSRLNKLDDVKKTVDDMSTTLEFLSGRYDELLKEVQTYKQDTKDLKVEVDRYKSECAKKSQELQLLSSRFNALEQYGRGVNLEIHGLVEADYESTETTLEKTARALGLTYNRSQIQAAHRLPTRDKNRLPVLLVQFVSKATKQTWLVEGRKKKLRSKDIVGVGEGKVYFNENLTPYYGKLFAETRKIAKDKGYEQVWVLNGSIRVKKSRVSRQTIIISSYEDLRKIN